MALEPVVFDTDTAHQSIWGQSSPRRLDDREAQSGQRHGRRRIAALKRCATSRESQALHQCESDARDRRRRETGGSDRQSSVTFAEVVCGRADSGRYNVLVISRGIREFVSRDWAAVRNSKDTYWAERINRLGPLEGLRIAEELRRQALLCDAGWPHVASRQADLLSHVHLAELLRRATPTRRP